jgi:hypothetical protein
MLKHLFLFVFGAAASVAATAPGPPLVMNSSLTAGTRSAPLAGLKPNRVYSLLYSVSQPSLLKETAKIQVELHQEGRLIGRKQLDSTSGDYFTVFRAAGSVVLSTKLTGATTAGVKLRVWEWPEDAPLETEPNDTAESANPIQVGRTVFAGAEGAGLEDWYAFEFTGEKPATLLAWLDRLERGSAAAGIRLYRRAGGKVVPLSEDDKARGYAMAILKERGTYLLRVTGPGCDYRLRTRLSEDPMDSRLVSASTEGEDWRGALAAALDAARQGHPTELRAQVWQLSERIASEVSPLYGFESEGALWNELANFPAEYLRREIALVSDYEAIYGVRREWLLKGLTLTAAKMKIAAAPGAAAKRARGAGGSIPADPVEALRAMDGVWEISGTEQAAVLSVQASAIEPLYRRQAIEAIGRTGGAGEMAEVARALGDECAMTQRTAAWAMRQIYDRDPGVSSQALLQTAPQSGERARWAAALAVEHGSMALAGRGEIARLMLELAISPVVMVRDEAVRALGNVWVQTADDAVRIRIEELLLQRANLLQTPTTETAVRESLSMLFENFPRALYACWAPAIVEESQREVVIRSRLGLDERVTQSLSRALTSTTDHQRKVLLGALRGTGKSAEPVLLGGTADNLSAVLMLVAGSSDAELRKVTAESMLVVRDIDLGTVQQGPELTLSSREQVRDWLSEHSSEYPGLFAAFCAEAPVKSKTKAKNAAR